MVGYTVAATAVRWHHFFPTDGGGMTSRHVKKVVVCVAELIAALVPIHGLLTFHTDMNGLP